MSEFVLFVIGQTTGQITFAAGDIFEHVCYAEDRFGHAARHQPHQQQADQRRQHAKAQFDQSARVIAGIQLLLERFGTADQDFLRYIEQNAPRRAAGNRRERRQHFQLTVAVQAADAAGGSEFAQQFGAADFVHGIQTLAEFAGVRAVTGEQAGGADDAHGGLAVIELLARALTDGLQAVEVDIDRQRGDDFAVDHQREDDAGHQHLLAVDHIEVRFDYTRFERGTRAGKPGVRSLAARAGAGVGHVTFRQGHRGDFAWRRLRPVQGETALVVAAQFSLTGEQFVLAVQRVGFEHQRQAEQVRVGLQRRFDLTSHVFAQVEGIEEAFLGLFAQEQHLPREAVAILIGVHELLANAGGLHFTLRLDARLRRLGEHFHARSFHQCRTVLHAIQRKTDQQGHDTGQAEAGEQGDFPLDGKLSERHGDVLIR
ncbi:hypothetical protein PS681_06069 [Pseudomonas fluorescens]|nr:hypothetical protein PS681_06069 [Pseudomonas fluorescens]